MKPTLTKLKPKRHNGKAKLGTSTGLLNSAALEAVSII